MEMITGSLSLAAVVGLHRKITPIIIPTNDVSEEMAAALLGRTEEAWKCLGSEQPRIWAVSHSDLTRSAQTLRRRMEAARAEMQGPASATRPPVVAHFLWVMATRPNGKLVRWATPAKVAALGLTTAVAAVEDTLVVVVLAKTAAVAVDRVTSEDMTRVANWWIQMLTKYVQQPALPLK
jgi:hypothetical protein